MEDKQEEPAGQPSPGTEQPKQGASMWSDAPVVRPPLGVRQPEPFNPPTLPFAAAQPESPNPEPRPTDVGAPFTPVPFARPLEAAYRPTADKIYDAVKKIL